MRLPCFGMQVALVSNGAEALKQIQEQYYPLILMDLGLPDKPGQEVAKEILTWQEENNRPISIIAALSAQLNKIERHNCFAAGMLQVYEKPLTIEKTRDLLKFIGI